MDEPVLAWYFAGTDRRMRHGGPWLCAGETHSFVGDLVLGDRGFHGCVDPLDAVVLGHGPIACRVRLGGECIDGPKRICAREMEVLSLVDAESVLRDAALRAVRDALPESVEIDADALPALREEVEDRTEALQDGEWAVEQGRTVDLQKLRDELEQAQRNATLVDAALRLNDSAFERLRSAIEDIHNREVDIQLELDGLDELTEDSSAIRSEAASHRGLLANADLLGRLLGHLRWVREAAVGTRRSDSMPVLFVDTDSRASDRTSGAHRVISAFAEIPTLPVFALVFDRTHAFEIDLARAKRFSNGVRPIDAAGTDRGRARSLTIVRPPLVVVDHEPTLLVRPKAPSTAHVADVLEPYLKPKPPKPKPAAPRHGLLDHAVPESFTNVGVMLHAMRRLRGAPIGAVHVWGPSTREELQEVLAPIRLEPALFVSHDGLARILISHAETDYEAMHDARMALRLPRDLLADVFWPSQLTRFHMMGPHGPRRRAHPAPCLATPIGKVAGLQVFSEDSGLPPYLSGRLTGFPWLIAAWKTRTDTLTAFELLRRDPDFDPEAHALDFAMVVRPTLIVGMVETNEWLCVRAGQPFGWIPPPTRRGRKLIYVAD